MEFKVGKYYRVSDLNILEYNHVIKLVSVNDKGRYTYKTAIGKDISYLDHSFSPGTTFALSLEPASPLRIVLLWLRYLIKGR